MSSPVAALPPLAPEDATKVLLLAHELYDLSIASRDECSNIARALLDVGCPSLRCLLEFPISSVAALQSELGSLKNAALSMLQLRRIYKWMEQQRTAAPSAPQHMPLALQDIAPEVDIGSKRPHDVSPPTQAPPLAAATGTFALQSLAAAEPCSATDAANVAAAIQFMEIA